MPRIADVVQDSVFYLYPTKEDARVGENIGGTGFFVGWTSTGPPPITYVYAVTCAHVIEDGSSVIRLNTKGGKWDIIERDKADWLQEPGGTDLAVAAVDPADHHKFKWNGIDDFLNDRMMKEYNIGPGDDVFMCGRFVNIEGKQRNTPVLRFGNIAMMPSEPVAGWQGVPQESFLVEMRSLSGFSGSPVFIYILPTEIRMDVPKWTDMQSGTFYGPWLLGVNWGHIPIYEKVLGPKRDKHGNRKPVNDAWDVPMISGMNAVTPAWRLMEFLMDDPDLNERRALLRNKDSLGK